MLKRGKVVRKPTNNSPRAKAAFKCSVRPPLIPGARLKNRPGTCLIQITRPAVTDIQLHKFATRLAHFPQIFVPGKQSVDLCGNGSVHAAGVSQSECEPPMTCRPEE